MKNLLQDHARRSIRNRVDALDPSKLPLWGKMNATQMLAHCSSQLRLCWGELQGESKQTLYGRWPINWAMIYLVPWPKGVPTLPAMIHPDADNWEAEKVDLLALVERFPEAIGETSLPHPIFGKLSTRAWGRLAWRHLDHHLRQFGA